MARLELTTGVGVGVVLGVVACALSAVGAWLVARRVLALPRPSAAVVCNASMQANAGFLGVPLAAALLGTDAIPQAIAYDSMVSVPIFLIGVFGVAAANGTRAGEGARARTRAFFLRNPPLIATIAGLLAPDALAPDVAVEATHVLVFAMVPLSFFAVGVSLAAAAGHGRRTLPPPFTRGVAVAMVFRLVVAPALLLAFSALIIDVPDAYLLLAAMPAGIHGITVAQAFGLDVPLAASIIAWTTVAGLAGVAAVVVIS